MQEHPHADNNRPPLSDTDNGLQEEKSLRQFGEQIHEIDNDAHKPSSIIDQTLAKKIKLDINFAKLGSVMMGFKFLLDFFISDDEAEDKTNNGFLKSTSEFARKLRQICQYSIHARPGDGRRKADDIISDRVSNIQATFLGLQSYKYNVFAAPWLGLAKMFFPYNGAPIGGLLSRTLSFADNTIGRLTNMFWNWRRVSISGIPYHGEITSNSITDHEEKVGRLISFISSSARRLFKRVALENILYKAFPNLDKADSAQRIKESTEEQKFREESKLAGKLFKDYLHAYLDNIKAFISGKYRSEPNTVNEKIKDIGAEEPSNKKWYVRMKILSQNVLGLPLGLGAFLANSAGILLDGFGNLFGSPGESLQKWADDITDFGNSLMSLIYITNEVPGNYNEYLKKEKVDPGNPHNKQNLAVAGIGALAMIHRSKAFKPIGWLYKKVGIKPLLDKFHRQLDNLFLLFFSANRYVYHNTEYNTEKKLATQREIEESKKHDSIYKLFSLPFRAIVNDPDVSYLNYFEEQNKKANLS